MVMMRTMLATRRFPGARTTLARHVWTPAALPGMSFAASDPVADRAAAVKFVGERGYEPAVAEAVVKALENPEWGAGPGGLLALSTRLAGRWEVGEDAGLHSLAKSVENEMAKHTGRALITFRVVPSRGEAFECKGMEGMSLKDVAEYGEGAGAEMLGEFLECACAGVMACSTCHVQVGAEWFAAVGPPSEAEEDMLDLAHSRTDRSRLGCQLTLTPALAGLVVHIPSGVNNMMDHIPFEDAARVSTLATSDPTTSEAASTSPGEPATHGA